MEQEIQFCSTPDNVSIAYASIGEGPPLVKAANWMNHLELDWKSPVWGHLLTEFSRDQRLIRYDERGTGLSDRKVDDLSLDAFVSDLEAVIEAVGLERFPLLGISQGGPVAIEYASRHPEKVTHLVIFGSFSAGWKKSDLDDAILEKRQAEATLIRQGWGSKNPAFRQFWTTLCIPDGRPDESESFNEMQRASASAENAALIFEAIGDFDVRGRLSKLDLPVLVMHSRDDATVPFEEGRRLASAIKNAKFTPLDSRNHLLMRHEKAWPTFVDEIRSFLGRQAEAATDANTRKMRTCPSCRRKYADEMVFCLDDGTRLADHGEDASHGNDETQILHGS